MQLRQNHRARPYVIFVFLSQVGIERPRLEPPSRLCITGFLMELVKVVELSFKRDDLVLKVQEYTRVQSTEAAVQAKVIFTCEEGSKLGVSIWARLDYIEC